VSRIQLRMNRLEDVIATGLRMLDVDPCREDAHRLLMSCYASQGRTYQALRQYDLCRRMLRATLETAPTDETTRLYHVIREGSAEQAPASGTDGRRRYARANLCACSRG